MAEYREEHTARYDYKCDGCGNTIEAGSTYVLVKYHYTTQTPVKHSKKLYHGTQYYHTEHHNEIYRYHPECEE